MRTHLTAINEILFCTKELTTLTSLLKDLSKFFLFAKQKIVKMFSFIEIDFRNQAHLWYKNYIKKINKWIKIERNATLLTDLIRVYIRFVESLLNKQNKKLFSIKCFFNAKQIVWHAFASLTNASCVNINILNLIFVQVTRKIVVFFCFASIKLYIILGPFVL
jgi:hypothetical protein